MIVYFRHGEDGTKSSEKFKQDVKLNPQARLACRKHARKLVDAYGIPDYIYCSPLRRTIETAGLCAAVIEETHKKRVPVLLRPSLSRFFVKKERDHLSVAPQTIAAGVVIVSTDKAKHNVRKGHRELVKLHKKRIIWCITHAVVIKEVRRMLEGKLRASDEHQPFLYTMVTRNERPK